MFPGGKKFAFTILDDTDVATLANVEPVYQAIQDAGMRTTKTVWTHRWQGAWSAFEMSETLEDADYREFVLGLQRRGFEIASHGASFESSERLLTEASLTQFKALFGRWPGVYASHAYNRENMYWSDARFDLWPVRAVARLLARLPADYFQGAVEGSRFFWGDLCRERIEFVRNLTFNRLDISKVNPSMPYHDAQRPWVNQWYSTADAEDADEFVELCSPQALNQLEADGGFTIVTTHLGKGFCSKGELHPGFRRVIQDIGRRSGWFVPVGELLRHLRDARGGNTDLPPREWNAMQWRWLSGLVRRNLTRRMRQQR